MIAPRANPVQIAARFYDARDSLRATLGQRYPSFIASWKAHLRDVMVAKQLDAVAAALVLCQAAQHAESSSGHLTMCILAAAVDVVEPEGKP